jgi:hypothetical protein
MKDGGQAYSSEGYDGMTMRQAYKLAVLTGIMSDRSYDHMKVDIIVGRCSALADAMIAEDGRHSKGEA